MRRVLAIGSCLVLAITTGCVAPPEEEATSISDELRKQCGMGKTTPGLDVAYCEGGIDFKKVRATGQRFVIARTNDGTFVDPRFVEYFKQAKAAGLLVGAYF